MMQIPSMMIPSQGVRAVTYELVRPVVPQSGVLFASPHSGKDYPENLLARTILAPNAIRSSEDAFMDELVADAPELGAVLLVARTPRAYVDLNRSADELDPAVIDGVRRMVHNPRVTSGLGVIPRVVANGQPIYRGKISLAEARGRIEEHWHPYHSVLRELMREHVSRFGKAMLVDCHSMPHDAIVEFSQTSAGIPDVVLGDRFGAAADPDFVECIEDAFQAEGLRVARNAPFAGAFVTQQYGRPAQGQHVVQVEIDRALYMDERRLEKRPEFDKIKAMMRRVMGRIIQSGVIETPMAAE